MASAWLPNGRAPLPAARCLADVDADVELADRLADDGGYRLAEREKGDREPGRDSYWAITAMLRRFWRSTSRSPIRMVSGIRLPRSRPLRAAARSSRPDP
jgi:hypothetical protein